MSNDQRDVSHIDEGEINKPIGNSEQLPVAVRYCFDGYGYLYMDAGSGSDWASRVKDCEFLYTHPMLELTEDEIGDVDAKFEKEFSPHGYGMPWENFLILIRAILKKASEK